MKLAISSSAPRLALGLLGIAALLAAALFAGNVQELFRPTQGYDVDRLVFLYATLPRLGLALLAGAGLGASGAILQMALRNPLASPTTIGIDGGARLAIAVALLFMPGLLGWGRDIAALAGSLLAMLLVLVLTRRQGFSPVPLVLAGLMVSLLCAAMSGVLQLTYQRYLEGLFIWGAGSLSAQGWAPVGALGLRLALAFAILMPLMRPLRLIELGSDSARGLGLKVAQWRMAAIFAGILPAAFVTSAVGVFGFIGLIAPLLATASGATTPLKRLIWSAATGAGLLLLTDLCVQWAAGAYAAFVPTGAVTAILGSPLLLWLLPRLSIGQRVPPGMAAGARPNPARLGLPALGLAVLVLLAVTLLVGRVPGGAFAVAMPGQWADLAQWRIPRTVAAFVAGALLGIAGLVLQRVSGNEMASPEILGIGAGALLGMAAMLLLAGASGGLGATGAGLLGGLFTILIVLGFSRRSGFAPDRVLLSGIAITALADAFIGVLTASGDPRGFQLLRLVGGSASAATWPLVLQMGAALAVIAAAAAACLRWLAMLPLGQATSLSLGVPLRPARLSLLALAALAAAIAVPVAGTVSFVGLMAPHLALRFGKGGHAPGPMLLRAALAGGLVMVVADWVARLAAFPFQLPTGLVACLVGGPFLLVLLQKRTRT